MADDRVYRMMAKEARRRNRSVSSLGYLILQQTLDRQGVNLDDMTDETLLIPKSCGDPDIRKR